jgi:hypothetical protein
MQIGLHALLQGAIDYAGTFPPARLSLDEAVRNYARYRNEPEQWLLGRFVHPASRLGELDACADLFQEGRPFCFSLVGRGGASGDEWLAGIRTDRQAVESFRQRHLPQVVTNVYESKLPEEPGPSWNDLLRTALTDLAERWTGGVMPFFEFALGEKWRSSVPPVLAAIAEGAAATGRPAGFKLRCGGLEAKAFPSAEQVAFVLCACRDAGVPLKLTAGLHHPIRRFDAGVGAPMHGFVNVFVAGVLAHARKLGEDALRPVLEEETAGNFAFGTDGGVRWRDQAASFYEIVETRQSRLIAFGSCSFNEPLDDLRSLGWLGVAT